MSSLSWLLSLGACSSYLSEPFDEEGEIQHEKLLNWCNYYGMPQYHVHSSGHASPHELRKLIETINPETVYPIHTDRPELVKRYLTDLEINVKLPTENKKEKI